MRVRSFCLLKKALGFFTGSPAAGVPGHQSVCVFVYVCVSMTVSGWRRRPWSPHRWDWCTAGSEGSAGGSTARWTSGGTGPGLPVPGQDEQHTFNKSLN